MSHFQTLINYPNIFSYFYQNHYCYEINKLTLMMVSLRSYWSWYWNQWNLCTRILGWVNYIYTGIIHRYISQVACVVAMIVYMGWQQAVYPSTNKKQLTLQYFWLLFIASIIGYHQEIYQHKIISPLRIEMTFQCGKFTGD